MLLWNRSKSTSELQPLLIPCGEKYPKARSAFIGWLWLYRAIQYRQLLKQAKKRISDRSIDRSEIPVSISCGPPAKTGCGDFLLLFQRRVVEIDAAFPVEERQRFVLRIVVVAYTHRRL